MNQVEHFIQDSCELLAVAQLQQLAEDAGRAITPDAAGKHAAYEAYRSERGIGAGATLPQRTREIQSLYVSNLATHLPGFWSRLSDHLPGERFDFVDTERDARNAGGREDFLICREGAPPIRMSLKNYRKSVASTQGKSGTFNSFIVNFLFESAGRVGMALHPTTGQAFKGSVVAKRNAAIEALGLHSIIPLMDELDEINAEIKKKFVYDPRYEFYDGDVFGTARKEYGLRGVAIAERILRMLDPDLVKKRVLSRAGLDRGDEVLLLDPRTCVDSLTCRRFQEVRSEALDPSSTVTFSVSGQTLTFAITAGNGEVLLPVRIPFTINSNGAWNRDGEPYEGVRECKTKGKQTAMLAWGQRRPGKCKELALSVNTYVDLRKSGILNADVATNLGVDDF
jgi:hypothetical protein